MRRLWLAAFAVLALLLLAGCSVPTSDGWVSGYMATSPEWHDPGIYDALPHDGRISGFTIQTVGSSPIPHTVVGGDEAAAIRLAALDAEWGAGSHHLKFARWDDQSGERTYRTLQFEPDYVQGWFGMDRTPGEARALFMEVAPAFLDIDDDRLARLADDFAATGRTREWSGEDGTPQQMRLFGIRLDVVPDFEAAFEARGLEAFDAETHIGATGRLPVPGQVTLVDGPWKFYVDTVMKRLSRGTDATGDLIWVAPTDVVQVVQFDRRAMTNDAGQNLERMMAELGRDAPDTSHWTFQHETLYHSFGD